MKKKGTLAKVGLTVLTGLGLAGILGCAVKIKEDYERIQKRHKKEEEEDARMRKMSGGKAG